MKKLIAGVAVLAALAVGFLAACDSSADVASSNLSKAADNFQIARRIVFYNGITGGYMLEIDGYCSLGNNDKAGELTVTCKMQDGTFKKDFLGLSDNVTYFVEQVDPALVATNHYRVVFNPSQIIPDVRVGS